jgi:hypothetical protein
MNTVPPMKAASPMLGSTLSPRAIALRCARIAESLYVQVGSGPRVRADGDWIGDEIREFAKTLPGDEPVDYRTTEHKK